MEPDRTYIVDCSGVVLWDPTDEDYERLREQERELIGGDE